MQIWPAIDIRGGQCVRLKQGDYNRETVFSDDPVQMARRWIEQGADRLHLVDLDGAREGTSVNLEVIGAIRSSVDVPCQLGGGLRDEQTIASMLDLGLERLVIGTKAVRDPEWFRQCCQRYPGKLALGIDAREGRVATDGWLETSDVVATEFAQSMAAEPVAAIIYTDIARDGMLSGPNLDAMAAMNQAVDLPVIASGGVSQLDDVQRLAELRLAGCIIGRSLYEGTLELAAAIAAADQNA